MIGAMQWAVALGRMHNFAALKIMSGFRTAPHNSQVTLEIVKRGYAKG